MPSICVLQLKIMNSYGIILLYTKTKKLNHIISGDQVARHDAYATESCFFITLNEHPHSAPLPLRQAVALVL